MENKLSTIASLLTRFEFQVVSPTAEQSAAPTFRDAGVFVIACEQPTNTAAVVNFSILEAAEADSLYEPLLARLSHWRAQRQGVLALISWIADKQTRREAVDAIRQHCKMDTESDTQ